MYRQTVRKPASIQTRKKEQVTQNAPVAASNSLSLQKIASYASSAKSNPQSSGAVAKAPVNLTGLPGNLKAGVEALSGFSLDSVRVHYNSPEPNKLNARAYTRGTDIYVGTGQERSLPHEAWHVVQQLQDRVRPTKKINSFNVNDSVQLEREADIMGARALSACKEGGVAPAMAKLSSGTVQCKGKSWLRRLKDIGKKNDTWESLTLLVERKLRQGGDTDKNIGQCVPRNINEWNELRALAGGLDSLQSDNLNHTIHHMLSRNKLANFGRSLSPAQQTEIITRFQHTHGNLNDNNDFQKILFSLRSNLVLGPAPESRSDDPAHQHGPKPDDFDPTYGEYAPVSDIYAQINDMLIHPDPNQTTEERNNVIIDLLTQAEDTYRGIQQSKRLSPDMLNTDVRALWVQENGYWRKRRRDEGLSAPIPQGTQVNQPPARKSFCRFFPYLTGALVAAVAGSFLKKYL